MSKKIKLFLTLLLIVIGSSCVMAQQENKNTLFPYPEPPKGMDNLYERSTYLTYHFWDKCNFAKAFDNPQQLRKAVSDWVACMPYCAADTVELSIGKMIDRISKSGPNLQTVCGYIEECVYTDSSDYYSEFIMYPFAKAASEHKKIKNPAKKHFSRIVQRIDCSQTGKIAQPISLICASDSLHPAVNITDLSGIATENILLVFYDPESMDFIMDRARLSADPSINDLINGGKLDIVAIYPGEADEKWRTSTSSMPGNWLVAASPEARDYFDMENWPTIYLLDKEHKIVARKVEAQNIIRAFQLLRYQQLNDMLKNDKSSPE